MRVEEFSDIRNYPTESVVREVMLFGTPPEQADDEPDARRSSATGFMQSIDMVAAGLGWTLDAEKRTTHEMAVATKDLDTPVGVLEAGTVAAQRFTWEGLVDGVPVITVRVNWLMGEEHLDPPWTFGPEGQRFEVEFDAEPPLVDDVPRPAPAGRRRAPRDRVDRAGDALRERDPVRVRSRARHQDLPRPAAARGPRRDPLRRSAGSTNAVVKNRRSFSSNSVGITEPSERRRSR